MSDVITVYAPGNLDPMDSYGLIGCELVRHLSRMGIHTNAISLGDHIHRNQDPELKELTSKPLIPSKGGILLGYPTGYNRYGELANLSPKIALTMFESSAIPEEWVPILNGMDVVVVPTIFCKNIFQQSGVTADIKVVSLGIQDVYKPVRRNDEDPFTFLAFMDRGKRKGGLLALDSFVKEFTDEDNVRLILKSRYAPPERVVRFLNDNIDVVCEDYDKDELYQLYIKCHCLVNPNKGEGFGLIPREFAATGGIALTTNWSGTAENIELWGFKIDYILEKADWGDNKNLKGKELGMWALPIQSDVQMKMRRLYEDRKFFSDLAFKMSGYPISLYRWDRCAQDIYHIWRNLSNGYH